MGLLTGFCVVQAGNGLAAKVCGRLFADAGAAVSIVGAMHGDAPDPLTAYLDHGKTIPPASAAALAKADLIIVEGGPASLRAHGHDAASLRRHNPRAVLVMISPFGQTGPRADEPATDLTLLCASFIARLLTGQVDDLAEPPLRAVGEQSAFIGGIAAACAGMHAALWAKPGTMVDVSQQEALATLAIGELTRAGTTGRGWNRKRVGDGNGATVCILPARDGYAAISPREEKQWAAWLAAMGNPGWGADPRFARKKDRVANWDALHALMSGWSQVLAKQEIADLAQAAHVPSFPLREPGEHFASAQLAHRGFYRNMGDARRAPGTPFGLRLGAAPAQALPDGDQRGRDLPLAGVRVLDFSWVIAGPTTTRTLAAMGADVIKVEAPGAGDPGRASELHSVLGQAKRAIVLDLKKPEAVAIARDLAARSDILIENFATGVMDRLGLGVEALRAVNPGLIYISASGLGRTGPEARAVAYGTLLQCYAGFAGLNRHPGRAPRVGMAWLDPMCALMLAFSAAAGLWGRARGHGAARIDFSMIEAMLWTMAAPVLAAADGDVAPMGNTSPLFAPHGVYRCAGADAWLGLAVRDNADWRALSAMVPALVPLAALTLAERRARGAEIDAALSGWLSRREAAMTATLLTNAGIPAAAVATSVDLVSCPHLAARGFWDQAETGVTPGLPWQGELPRRTGPAPALGTDTGAVLAEVLGLSDERIAALRASLALG